MSNGAHPGVCVATAVSRERALADLWGSGCGGGGPRSGRATAMVPRSGVTTVVPRFGGVVAAVPGPQGERRRGPRVGERR
jgi:hypothetical protein